MLCLVWIQIVLQLVMVILATSSPGAGFLATSYSGAWILSLQISSCYAGFFCWCPLPKGFASTLIFLIPKKQSPNSFANYRPINVCNFVTKVFSKILCARIQPLMSQLISEDLSAFITGWDISENVLLVQELIHWIDKRIHGNNLVFKFYMLKAFDRVSCEFLEALMELKFT